MDEKTRLANMLPTRVPPQNKRPTQTESEGLEKILQENGQGEKAGIVILTSEEIDFKQWP